MKIQNNKVNPYFEKNKGQFEDNLKYKVKANNYVTFFTQDKLIAVLPSNKENSKNVFYMKLENSNSNLDIEGQDKQIGIVNYLIGKDKSKWITDINTYSKIKYKDVYENIDLYYYINNGNLEYDLVLSKGANPKDISISFQGLDKLEIDEDKNLVLYIGDIKAKLLKPEVYQIIDNERIYVDCEYELDENNFVNFLIREYEEEYELVLDPVLTLDYSTFIGGKPNEPNTTLEEIGYEIAIDSSNNVYITGQADENYPITAGAYQSTFGGYHDAFVTKLSRDGKTLIYSTYLGGTGDDYGSGIAVDIKGYAYVTGSTSGSFPITSGAYQTTFAGKDDAFVTKLSKDGNSLIYSTYLGGSGSDYANAISVDNLGCVYVTGQTNGIFPTTSNAYQTNFKGGYDAFVTKLSEDGSELIYSTHLGGSSFDYGNAISVDSEGYAYITGRTDSNNFPTTQGAYQTVAPTNSNVFVTKLNTDGSGLVYSTYIGGSSSDYGYGIDIDDEGCVYITGQTNSTNYPITLGVYQDTLKGGNDVFVSKLNKNGTSLIFSTYIGGTSTDIAYGIKVDSNGCTYVTGVTSGGYPVTEGAYQSTFGGGDFMYAYDVFISKLNRSGSSLIYSTYLGGSDGDIAYGVAIDSYGGAYVAGVTYSNNYPVTPGAYQTTMQGSWDVFVSKITPVELDFTWSYTPTKGKLLDIINTNLSLINNSSTNIDISIKYQTIDSSVSYVPESLEIQNINPSFDTIPEELYIPNIPPKEPANISMDLKYINEVFPERIVIVMEIGVYSNKTGIMTLVDSTIKVFYINTGVGPNYIHGCNDLYNLYIDGKLQTTNSGTPIIYYKSGSSYIYIEPDKGKYVYKILSNPSNVVEYKIVVKQ